MDHFDWSLPIKILDHGYIRLVDHMGSDDSVERSARVSYSGDKTVRSEKETKGLLRYLMKNGHTTPFESCTLTFEVKAPIFVYRQWHRHRTQSYNEISARYAVLPNEIYVPSKETIGKQSKLSKQARDIDNPNAIDYSELQMLSTVSELMRAHSVSCYKLYEKLIKYEVPRELARSVLPVATYSRMYTTMNLHNLYNFLRLRLHFHAQYEIRQYAKVILTIVRDLYPISTKAFEDFIISDKESFDI